MAQEEEKRRGEEGKELNSTWSLIFTPIPLKPSFALHKLVCSDTAALGWGEFWFHLSPSRVLSRPHITS